MTVSLCSSLFFSFFFSLSFVIPRYEGSTLYCTRYFTYASIDPSCLGMTKQNGYEGSALPRTRYTFLFFSFLFCHPEVRGICTLLYSLFHIREYRSLVPRDDKAKWLRGISTSLYSLLHIREYRFLVPQDDKSECGCECRYLVPRRESNL